MNESEAIAELRRVKTAYQKFIRDNFEFSAKDCGTCTTFGVCCTDAHFVNVHITRLEAVAIRESIISNPNLSEEEKQSVFNRTGETVEKYDLKDTGETFSQTFACPLFDRKLGCLVHNDGAKPAPCIQHACYENKQDLPPDCLQDAVEDKIEKLNRAVYGKDWRWLQLPILLGTEISK
ncbi:MAG: hypothetical protein M3209_12640 [Acidobacteriota bacterium]|nr:hypothetical protein [Acidobacteriota bacterium]